MNASHLQTFFQALFVFYAAFLIVRFAWRTIRSARRSDRETARLVAVQTRLKHERAGDSFDEFEPYFAALGVDREVIRLAWSYLQTRSHVGDFPFQPHDSLADVAGLPPARRGRRDTHDTTVTTDTALEEIVHSRTGEYPDLKRRPQTRLQTVEDLVLTADALVARRSRRKPSTVRN